MSPRASTPIYNRGKTDGTQIKKTTITNHSPLCAGIDIGSQEHWVAVDPDKAEEPVRCFSSFTDSLNEMADWLERVGVEIVAMEATGVYWIPLFELLDRRGFKVQL